MPWDLIAVLGKQSLPSRELSKDWLPEVMGTAKQVRAQISSRLPGLEWDSYGFAGYIGDGFSLEIHVPGGGVVRMVSFAVRGGGDPLPELVGIAKANGWWLLDEAAAEWIDLDSPSRKGREAFRAYRDRVISGEGSEGFAHSQPRSSVQRPREANLEHVEAVKLGAQGLARWKRKHALGIPLELSGADLQGIDLKGAILTGSDLTRANLAGADLSGALLRIAKLRGANLSKANLSGARMSGIDLREANVSGAALTGADLSGNDLGEANLIGANLREADLVDTNLSGVVVEADDWFALLKQRQVAPRNIEKLERHWRSKPAENLKNVAAGDLEPGQWFQLWPRKGRKRPQ